MTGVKKKLSSALILTILASFLFDFCSRSTATFGLWIKSKNIQCYVCLPVFTSSYAYTRIDRFSRFCYPTRNCRHRQHGLSPRSSPKFNTTTINCLVVVYRSFYPGCSRAAVSLYLHSIASPIHGSACRQAGSCFDQHLRLFGRLSIR